MPKTSKQCEVIKEERRNAIIEESLHLFCLEGFADVSVDDICNKLKISHGLFYHYFTNKEDVQKAVFEKAKLLMDKQFLNIDISKKGLDFISQFNHYSLMCLRQGKLYAYYIYFTLDTAVNNRMVIKDKAKPSNRLLIEAIKTSQKNHQIINGDYMEIYFTYLSLLKGLAYSVIKSKKQTDYIIPEDEIPMNLFYKKEIK